MRGLDTSPGKGGFDLPGRSTSPVGSARKRARSKDPRGSSSAKKRRMTGLPMAPGSYKGAYKMEDSFSSSDESGQDEERGKAAAGVRMSTGQFNSVLPFTLGKPSREKSAVFLNIVQKAFDPPPPFRLNIMQNLQ